MKNMHLLICLTGRLIADVICSIGGYLSGNIPVFSFFPVTSTFFNRLMPGFIIGISSLKTNYIFHGMLMGFLVSLISSISFLENGITDFLFFTSAGIFYGLLIELFATKIFKAGMEA